MIYELTNLKTWFLSIDGMLIRPGQMRPVPVLSEGARRFASGADPLISIKEVPGIASIPGVEPELQLSSSGAPAPKIKIPPPPPPKAIKVVKPSPKTPPVPTPSPPPKTEVKAEEVPDKVESPVDEGNREEIILHEMRQMILEGKDLTAKGMPELPELNDRLSNYNITTTLKERKKLFKKLNQ